MQHTHQPPAATRLHMPSYALTCNLEPSSVRIVHISGCCPSKTMCMCIASKAEESLKDNTFWGIGARLYMSGFKQCASNVRELASLSRLHGQ